MGPLSRRVLLAGVILLLVGGGVGLWLGRDVPRATLVRQLEAALDADVRLGALEIVGSDRVVLHELRIDRPGRAPIVRWLEIARVDVEGSLGELRRGRVRGLIAGGVRGVVEPTEALLVEPPDSGDTPAWTIGRVRTTGVEIRLAAVDRPPGEPAARVAVDLSEVGDAEAFSGTVGVQTERLDVGLLLRRFGADAAALAQSVDATWTIDTAAAVDRLVATAATLDVAIGALRVDLDAISGAVDLAASTAELDADRGSARGSGAILDLGAVRLDAAFASADDSDLTAEVGSRAWRSSSWRWLDDGFSGRIDGLRLDRLTPPDGLPAIAGDADVRLAGAAAGPRAEVDLRPTRIRFADAEPIDLTASQPPTTATLVAQPNAAGEVEVERVRARTDLALWHRLVADQLPAVVRDFALGGIASVDWRLDGDRVSGPLRLERVGAVSEDGGRVIDGLSGEWQVDGRWSDAPWSIEARLTGRHDGFLLLWNTVYADFSTATAKLDLDAAWQASNDWSTSIEWRPDGGPTIALDLATSSDGPAPTYGLRIDDETLDSTFATYLQPLTADTTTLRDLGGRFALELGGSLGGSLGRGRTAAGKLTLEDTRIATSDTAIESLYLDLPIDLRWLDDPSTPESAATQIEGPKLEGRMAFGSLATRGFTMPAVVSAVRIEGDDIGLVQPLGLDVLGGRVTLERFTLRDMLGSAAAETGLRLDGLDLAVLARNLDLPALDGRLDGQLPRVRVAGSELSVAGGGTIQVFGGEVDLFDMAGREIFSDFPELSLSAELRGLDLGLITRRFDVGEMTGILDGRIDQLTLFRGLPTAFQARFESVERKSVEQTVDVKAVRNLTILGTGSDPGALDRGLTRVLSRFRYAELGVEVSLDHDVLLLRGLIERNDKELFLAGRFPFGIDVVNARPGQTVSFQTMVRRLQALDTSRVRTD